VHGALTKLFAHCMEILCRKTAKQTWGSRIGFGCGSRTETMQKNILN